MSDRNTPPAPDEELDSFDTFSDDLDQNDGLDDVTVDDARLDARLADDSIDDADFQDISDDVDADVFGEGEPAPAPAKKTNWFNIGVAGIAVLVAGVLIWTKIGPQIMSDGSAPENTQQAASGANTQDSNTAAQQAIQPAGAGASVNGGGVLDNPDQYAALGTAMPAGNTGGTPVASEDPFANISAEPTANGQGEVPMPAPISAVPMPGTGLPQPTAPKGATTTRTAGTLPDGTAAQPATNAQPELVQPEIVQAGTPVLTDVTATATGDAVGNAGLETKVLTLESRLDAMDAKLNQAVEKMQAPVDDTRLSAIQTSLERLESRLDTMNASAPAQRSAPRASVREASDDVITGDGTPAPVKKRSGTAKKASKPKSTSSHWDQPYAPQGGSSGSLRNASASSGNGGWELRGAQPGRAIIARGGDIREVAVGDNVPGLGEVTGVASMNGNWVVQGTGGRVSQ